MKLATWRCEECGANGLIKPDWGEHTGDIIADTHRDMNPTCDTIHNTTAIRVSAASA